MASEDTPTTIAGIGASAGGISAMRALLPKLPVDDGLAYVLSQHLDPTHVSMLGEILSRAGSELGIEVIDEGQPVQGGRLYIVPPHAECTLRNDRFQLKQSEADVFPRHTIDTLLMSIAEARGEHAIGIILSGTGSDGLDGIRTIKGSGGSALIQDPDEAEYPGMPMAVVRERLADVVVPIDEMGDAIRRILDWPTKAPAEDQTDQDNEAFAALIRLLVRRTGLAFDQYKESTLRRRISRRMVIAGDAGLAEYRRRVERSDAEVEQLRNDLLISVTSFFRDAETFEAVRDALATMAAARQHADPIRIWVPGCATGEEAYSIAILAVEALGEELNSRQVQIFATDVDEAAISTARRGVYLKSRLESMPPEVADKYFESEDGACAVKRRVRDLVTFATQDLLQDPPFSRLDMVSCRNVLIYFKRDAQERLMETFHYVLNPGGYLVLGPSENVPHPAGLFESVSSRARIFTRVDTESTLPRPALPAHTMRPATTVPSTGRVSIEQQIRDVLFEQYLRPSVLVDAEFNALYVHGDVSPYMHVPRGNVTASVLEMVDVPLRVELRLALHKSMREHKSVQSRPVFYGEREDRHAVILTALPVARAGDEQGRRTLLVFDSYPVAGISGSERDVNSDDTAFRIHELEQELNATRDHLQTNVEELEASNEELQSLNEEYQSTTEELQSANEELQTTNEELQSTNEELSTVNEELQVRSEELSGANRDLEDILNTAVTGIVVLDDDLRVTRYSAASKQIFDLLPTSIGRPLIAVGGAVDLALLSSQIQEALARGTPVEQQLELGDKAFLVHYIPRNRGESGLIISFVDVTEELRGARQAQRLAAVLRDASDAMIVHRPDGRIVAWNRGVEKLYGYTEAQALEMNIYDLTPPDQQNDMHLLTERIMSGERVAALETSRLSSKGEEVDVALTATPLLDADNQPYAVATTERDVSMDRAVWAQRRQAALAHEERLTTAGEMAAGLAHELNQPLTAITHFSELAINAVKDSRMKQRHEVLEALEGIADQASRAAEVLRSLRRFMGQPELPRQPQDINQVIRETLGFMGWELTQAGVGVQLDLTDGLPQLFIDRTQIEQVLVNLLRNSMDAMVAADSDPRQITISTALLPDADIEGVQVSVQDTGPGISREDAQRIFDPFHTSKPNGLGIGLWISHSIVEAHGGRLWPDLDVASGTTFHFTLPSPEESPSP